MPFQYIKHFFPTDEKLYISEFGHSQIDQPKTVGPWSREIYLLHLVTKGYADFSGFRAREGQAFLISKERMHSFTVSENYEHYWIGFEGFSVGTILDQFELKHDQHQLFFVENYDFIKQLFSTVFQSLRNQETEHADSLIHSLLLSILPLLKNETESKADVKIAYAEKAYLYIKINYMYPLNMESIAKEIHISEKYMYRLFMERFHISPQQFLIKTRMEAAMELLQKSNLTVSEVAISVGYALLPAFSKAFTRYFGVSPIAVKKQRS